MNQSKIPVRYARGLFLLGKEKKILDKLAEDIMLLSSFFENTPSLDDWLRSPVIKTQGKKDLFRNQFEGELSEETLGFLDLVINKKRERFFPGIFRNFIRLYKEEAGIKTLVLTTAVKIDDTIKQKLSLIFSLKDKTKHEFITRIKPSIIGGFMVQVDDLLYDASLATELKRIKKKLTGLTGEIAGSK
jgi:F-type H+-transporting ATPase subunit delta